MSCVDVVLLTKNSERILERCLNSIYKNVPIKQLIVVDGYSVDNTRQILKSFQKKYKNIKLIFDNGTRATARQRGISHVNSDWFLFVDSDVVLCSDWYKKALRHVDDGVGAVWGTEVWSTIKSQKMLKVFLLVTRKIFDVRGGTHDILIKKELVKDITIPEKKHMFEDAFIKDWITKKGFKTIACYTPFCIHYRPSDVWTFRGSLNLIAEAFRFGNARMIFKLLSAYGVYTAYSVYQLLLNGKSKSCISQRL